MNEERNSNMSKGVCGKEEESCLDDQSNSSAALPSHCTQARVPTGPDLSDATLVHENPFSPKWNQLALGFFLAVKQ